MRDYKHYKILNEKAEAGYGIIVPVKDFQNAVITIATSNNANFTAKVLGSSSEDAPTFSSAASPTNQHSFLQIINLDDGVAINGAAGVSSAGTDICKQYEVNVNGQNYITVQVSTYAAGKITVDIQLYNAE